MSLLELKGIGKIYVSEGSVAVGIRGVDLSFDKGEFVAITGRSGSGKSTLLNVISGMDSYEEGELFIEGQPTSHYMQPDWEEYREKYISFIFQDYNIIESFTVLQNVELALMHIEDKRERRRRALDLISRVGLSSHIKQKGSKLSGGQKQRTVIARALAKDSPIILADEPTGNLDYETSKEIIDLLHEVSRDKLLIVVTHNFEQVEQHATRHVRIFDGAVESDHCIKPGVVIEAPQEEAAVSVASGKRVKRSLKNGITLGRTIFTAKPRLSIFLCLLMVIGTLGIFLITSLCGGAADIFDKHYMFEPIDGRVIITKPSGEPISEEELDKLVKEYGADSALHYDALLDQGDSSYVTYYNEKKGRTESLSFKCTYGEDFGRASVGEYPVESDEVLLYLPISYRPTFGTWKLKINEISYNNTVLKVSGVKYFYDNNKDAKMLFTEDGFRTATAINYFTGGSSNISIEISNDKGEIVANPYVYGIIPSFDVQKNKLYIDSKEYQSYMMGSKGQSLSTKVYFRIEYYSYNYDFLLGGGSSQQMTFTAELDGEHITNVYPSGAVGGDSKFTSEQIIIHPLLLRSIAEESLALSYRQASLFYENDKAANEAIEQLKDAGYIAVSSKTTYSPDALSTILLIIGCAALAFVWILTIIFLAFFINLCSTRALGAFKNDMSIMRSMGIPVKVIRIGMYVRMLISLIPAFIMVISVAVLIFTVPLFNQAFTYLYLWQYAVIFLGMLILTVRITHKQIRKLFRVSVKKSMKGGAGE